VVAAVAHAQPKLLVPMIPQHSLIQLCTLHQNNSLKNFPFLFSVFDINYYNKKKEQPRKKFTRM